MIKKIFFLGSLVLISNLFYSRANIPVNSSENKFIKKWVVAKIENLNNDSISNLTLNTQDFLKGINQNNVREIKSKFYYKILRNVKPKTFTFLSKILTI